MPVGTERGHRVREVPDLLVLGVEDVRAVGLVEDARHVLGSDQAARHGCAFEQHALDALAGQAVRNGAAREAGTDDEDP